MLRLVDGDRQGALQSFREIVAIDPAEPRALRAIVELDAADGKLDDAVNVIRESLRRRPQSADLHDLLGHVFMQRRDWTQARTEFEEERALEGAAGRADVGLAEADASMANCNPRKRTS